MHQPDGPSPSVPESAPVPPPVTEVLSSAEEGDPSAKRRRLDDELVAAVTVPADEADRTVFIGQIPGQHRDLRNFLREKYGEILQLFFPLDKKTNLHRGFCFVKFRRAEDAESLRKEQKISFPLWGKELTVRGVKRHGLGLAAADMSAETSEYVAGAESSGAPAAAAAQPEAAEPQVTPQPPATSHEQEEQELIFDFHRNQHNFVFLGGVPHQQFLLKDVLSKQFGAVQRVVIMHDRRSGLPKPYGFITFYKSADAETAKSVGFIELWGVKMPLSSAQRHTTPQNPQTTKQKKRGGRSTARVPTSAPSQTTERKQPPQIADADPLSVFVGGLPPQVTELQINAWLQQQGLKVEQIKLVTDTRTGCCKGYGFIRFQTAEDAHRIRSRERPAFRDRTLIIGDAKKRDV